MYVCIHIPGVYYMYIRMRWNFFGGAPVRPLPVARKRPRGRMTQIKPYERV